MERIRGMKTLLMLAVVGWLVTGCANQGKQETGETGNGLGGSNVAGSFPGSVGAGNKAATGSNPSGR